MNIEIHNPELQERLRRQLETGGSASLEDVLLRLLDTQEEQDRWLTESRDVINGKIQRGMEQLDRGEAVTEDEMRATLARLKSQKR